MTTARKPRSSGSWRAVYGGPLLLGGLSIAGLLSALLSEGPGRYFSWLALGAENIDTRGRDIDAGGAKVAEGRELIVGIAGGHAEADAADLAHFSGMPAKEVARLDDTKQVIVPHAQTYRH